MFLVVFETVMVSIFLTYAFINLNLLVITNSLLEYMKTIFFSIEFIFFIIGIFLISFGSFWHKNKR